MSWRRKFLTSRLHPLAFTCYTITVLFGTLFTFHLMHTEALQGVHPWVDWTWRVMLLVGGLFGLASICTPPRKEPDWPDLVDLLRIESMAAGLSGLGWVIYAYSIADIYHDWWNLATLALGIMGAGLIARSFQATIEAEQAKTLGRVYDEADPALKSLLEEPHREP